MSRPNLSKDEFVPPPPGEILGHPSGLWMLFASEFWERFCYYGLRAILAPYVAAAFFGHLNGENADAEASLAYGGYTALVYALGIFGGYIADKYLGYQRSIMLGGAFMAAGMFLLLSPNFTVFLLGLATVVVGNGLFKPNISTMVGKLYAPGDVRRDSGFTIFYMGINAGAFIAPIICGGLIGERYGFKWGFFTAGIGMLLGLFVFQWKKASLGHIGVSLPGKEGFNRVIHVALGCIAAIPLMYLLMARGWQNELTASLEGVPVIYPILREFGVLGTILGLMMLSLMFYLIRRGMKSGDPVQTQRYAAMNILFLANMCFWAMFEQAGSSLNFLARDYVDMPFGWNFTVFQAANPVFIILLAPLFAMLWPWLDRRSMNPSIPRKFALALLQVAAGFYVLVWVIGGLAEGGMKIHWMWLTLCYFLHTTGELCLSPIGLSMITKLAAPKEVGVAMGGWFLSIACANFVAGVIAAIASGGGAHGAASGLGQYATTFSLLVWFGVIAGVLFLVVAPLINKLMHGVK